MNKNEIVTKGHNYNTMFCWYLQFFQKTNEKSNLTTMVPQVELFSFVFWKN